MIAMMMPRERTRWRGPHPGDRVGVGVAHHGNQEVHEHQWQHDRNAHVADEEEHAEHPLTVATLAVVPHHTLRRVDGDGVEVGRAAAPSTRWLAIAIDDVRRLADEAH